MTGASLGNPPVHTDGAGKVVVSFIDRPPLVCSPLEAELLASLLMAKARKAKEEAEAQHAGTINAEPAAGKRKGGA